MKKKETYYRCVEKCLAENLSGKMLAAAPGTSVDCYEINISDNSNDRTVGAMDTPPKRAEGAAEREADTNSLIVADKSLGPEDLSELPDLDDA